MDKSDLREMLRRRIAAETAVPPLERVQAFLHEYFEDAMDLAEARESMQRAARAKDFRLGMSLEALDVILAEPQPPGTLLRLAEFDANWDMDHDQTDAGAAVFLRGLADMLQSVITESS